MTADVFTEMFRSFCPVSGSPVRPRTDNTWAFDLELLQGGQQSGAINFCCWPCACDTVDFIQADTKSVTLANGVVQEFTFLVIGNPCGTQDEVEKVGQVPSAPELYCDHGILGGATMSDNGGIIIGMLVTTLQDAAIGQDPDSYASLCADRASNGYAGGMGMIFRSLADVNALSDYTLPPATTEQVTDGDCGEAPHVDGKSASDWIANTQGALLLTIPNMRCGLAAEEACSQHQIPLQKVIMSDGQFTYVTGMCPVWDWLHCSYPNDREGGTIMHSYFFYDGKFIGQGFEAARQINANPSIFLASAGTDTQEPTTAPEDSVTEEGTNAGTQTQESTTIPEDSVTEEGTNEVIETQDPASTPEDSETVDDPEETVEDPEEVLQVKGASSTSRLGASVLLLACLLMT